MSKLQLGKAPDQSTLAIPTDYENQSCIADLANECETNRTHNDNFRLDMTWVDQEAQRAAFATALTRCPTSSLFHYVVLTKETHLGFLTYLDGFRLAQTSKLMRMVFKKGKGLKKLVRYGNLEPHLRPAFWKRITEQPATVKKVQELAGIDTTTHFSVDSLFQ